MPIDPAALEALRLLLDIAGPDRVVVIGASVPIVRIDLRYGLAVGRTTRDVDVVVRATSWEEYEDLKRRLLGAGFRQARVPHRLEYGPAELEPDLIKGRDVRPFGAHWAASCCAAPRSRTRGSSCRVVTLPQFSEPLVTLPAAGAGRDAVYPSLGIGADPRSQYQKAWRAAMTR